VYPEEIETRSCAAHSASRLLKRTENFIVKKLNEDSQRVWLGRNSNECLAEFEDMTYKGTLVRVVDLARMTRLSETMWLREQD